LAALADVDRPGRPKTVDQRKIIAETLPPPAKLGGYALVVTAARVTLKLNHAAVVEA
jgi:hypothetical protein